ncbi:9265_t:CDS:2 [Scutellospora calospora]|uniref:9265_t:CDS:1 n=1 Tax=Scutellospora calospora TaxID=85575 RepID=A0ACA9L7L3_9GLOM|nr:9265_t:CDS:2 [Scutellospora calospora]
MEMLLSTSPNFKSSSADKESVIIPLTVVLKIFTKKIEDRCIEVSKNKKYFPRDLVNNAKSACDRYNFLVHSDVKNTQGICGITGHWMTVNYEEWKNELEEIRKKEIEENAVKISQNKTSRKKQNKLLQGPLESKVQKPVHPKRKAEQEARHEEIKEQQDNKISWADEAEMAFDDVGPQQASNLDPSSKDIEPVNANSIMQSFENLYVDNKRDVRAQLNQILADHKIVLDIDNIGDKQSDDPIGNLGIGGDESKKNMTTDKEMGEMDDEEDTRTLDEDDEDIGTPDAEHAEISDDDEEDLRTPDAAFLETSDKESRTPDTGFISQKMPKMLEKSENDRTMSPVQSQNAHNEAKEKSENYRIMSPVQSQDAHNEARGKSENDLTMSPVQSPDAYHETGKYLREYSKIIYKALLAELDSRHFLYETDKEPRVSDGLNWKEKSGQKRRKFKNKLLRHSINIKDGGLAVRRNNVKRMQKVINSWEEVICDVVTFTNM